jgi:hypothetical protein
MVERGTPASHSSVTVTMKVSSVCYLWPEAGSPVDGLDGKGCCNGHRLVTVGRRLLPWKHLSKGPLPLCGMFFMGV